jgi:hypothetical protein
MTYKKSVPNVMELVRSAKKSTPSMNPAQSVMGLARRVKTSISMNLRAIRNVMNCVLLVKIVMCVRKILNSRNQIAPLAFHARSAERKTRNTHILQMFVLRMAAVLSA